LRGSRRLFGRLLPRAGDVVSKRSDQETWFLRHIRAPSRLALR
jgi:hypothetical protein